MRPGQIAVVIQGSLRVCLARQLKFQIRLVAGLALFRLPSPRGASDLTQHILPRCPEREVVRDHIGSMLPNQNLFERQEGEDVLPPDQLRVLVFPAAPSQRFLSGAPTVLVTAFSP